MGPMHWTRGWGLAYGVCPWGSALVMGDLMGSLSGGGGGGEEETPGHVLLSRFRRMTRVSEQPFLCYILYIEQWRFRCSMRQTVANGDPDPRYPGQTRALFELRQPVDLVHALRR